MATLECSANPPGPIRGRVRRNWAAASNAPVSKLLKILCQAPGNVIFRRVTTRKTARADFPSPPLALGGTGFFPRRPLFWSFFCFFKEKRHRWVRAALVIRVFWLGEDMTSVKKREEKSTWKLSRKQVMGSTTPLLDFWSKVSRPSSHWV